MDSSQLQQSLVDLFGLYFQVETNAKLKAETEQKYSVLMDRLASGSLHDLTLQRLSALCEAVESNNGQASGAAFRDLTAKCWNDVKDFSNALKTLSQFRQKFGQ